ncbi:TrbI/VirB10 family protein [Sphingobium sp. MI1205]|uniref:TrbI/VirB10 family protein n=1 Tax=Sphingobium sp. MI1205 TaxID=407020 RepID=UPI00076FF493|nr:TrbI/VirB10 family protein [Sphingobium sp. MI1205]AMK18921.1 conjugal transfer protein TrbI [Sphingobium sp. MI1205]
MTTDTAAAPKVDPETLVLRASPTRAIRFRRGAIIGIAALCSASLMGIAWLALKPQIFRKPVQASELSQPMGQSANDAVAALPSNYGDAPRLGPPLPGDLGRPILRAQQQQLAPVGTRSDSRSAADAAEAERLAKLAELKAARQSGVMVQIRSSDQAPAPAEPPPAVQPMATTPAAQEDRKIAFAERKDTASDSNPHEPTAPVSPYMLAAGSVIAASLITGLNSDLPGLVIAQVTQHVFDSATGQFLLVPQGARLIGKYDSLVAFGQRRALIIWQRIILPDGSSLRLDNMPATDASGYAGLEDKVNFHSWALLKGVGIATLLGVGSELSISGESDLVEAIHQSTQQNVSRAGDQLTSRNLDVQPTIMIRPGAPVRLLVSRDLRLAPWRGIGGGSTWPI